MSPRLPLISASPPLELFHAVFGPGPALRRAGQRAEALASATNTALVQVIDSKILRV